MNKDELSEKRNQAIKSLNDIKALLGLDELYIDELETELKWERDTKTELAEHLGKANDKVADLEETINKLREQLALRYDLEDKIKNLEAQIEKMKKYIKACWVEENLNDYSSYITNTSDEFRDLVKELNEEIRNGR